MQSKCRLIRTISGGALLMLGHSVSQTVLANELDDLLQEHWQDKQNQPVEKSSIELKVTGDLLNLVRTGALPKGSAQSVLISQNMAATEFLAAPQQGAVLEQFLRSNGVIVQSSIDDVIFGFVSPTVLRQITNSPLIQSARFQGVITRQNNEVSQLLQNLGLQDANTATVQSDQYDMAAGLLQPATARYADILRVASQDEGVIASHAQLLHQRQMLGQGMKIGVIDFGYGRYPELQRRGLVPTPRQTYKFNQNNTGSTLNISPDANEHGTACTEIIYKMAPAAEYYVAQVGDGYGRAGDGDLMAAIDWMIQQGVNIINFSGGGHRVALDGTSPIDRKVQQAVARNILWVNAAGNEGDKHWSGVIQDRNQNNLVDTGADGDLLTLVKRNNGPVEIIVNWNDWYSSSQPAQQIDVDVFLLQRDANGRYKRLAQAVDVRPPHSAALEVISGQLSAGTYYLALSSDRLSNRRVHVVVGGATLQQANAAGSIGAPATAEAALSVGAWDVQQRQIASYSSRGPTTDGRVKPDLAAPAGVLNAAYGYSNMRFDGTSAAAPYVAGFAAQLWASNRGWSATQLKSQLMQRFSKSLGGAVPSMAFGYGLIDARQFFGGNNGSSSNITNPSTDTISDAENDGRVGDLIRRLGL